MSFSCCFSLTPCPLGLSIMLKVDKK
jgi:hypothetical protein